MSGFPGKKPPYSGLTQASVIESPINTTRKSNLAGAGTAALASAYRARFGQSCRILSVLSSFAASDGRSAQSGEPLLGAFAGVCAWAVAATSNTATIVDCTVLLGLFTESPRRIDRKSTRLNSSHT